MGTTAYYVISLEGICYDWLGRKTQDEERDAGLHQYFSYLVSPIVDSMLGCFLFVCFVVSLAFFFFFKQKQF